MLVLMDQQQLEASSASLRAVIEEIDAGRLKATGMQRAHLVGSLQALSELAALTASDA